MNSRQRFNEVMRGGNPDRVPFFEEGVRSNVIKAWRQQGMPGDVSLAELFPFDRRVEIAPELLPNKWPDSLSGLEAFRRDLDPADPARLPADWPEIVSSSPGSGDTILLRVHRGLYQTLGVANLRRFAEANLLLKDDPGLVKAMLVIQAQFAAALVEHILSEVAIDAAIFSEPISGTSGPLISPRMFDDLINTSYQPLLDVLRRRGVETIIFRTYANSRILLPVVFERGFNALWACETTVEAMDYADIRREYGRDLRLIAGIEIDALRRDKETIRRELYEKVPLLLEQGGFIPLANGRVRAVVPYDNYVYYRRLLAEIVRG
jgi:hypothetical protein